MLLTLLILPAGVFATPTTQQGDFKVFVTGNDKVVHELALKVQKTLDERTVQVKGFAVNPESLVQITHGSNLLVFTSESNVDLVEKVKLKDVNGIRTELLPLENNQFFSAGLASGVYILDVIVDMPTSENRGRI